jgi:hypothetical protein
MIQKEQLNPLNWEITEGKIGTPIPFPELGFLLTLNLEQ